MAAPVTPTNTDFQVEFNALRLQARNHGLNPNESTLAKFLQDTAEVLAQRRAQERFLYRLLQPKLMDTPVDK